MLSLSPEVVIVAGPNGAGKSTTAPHLLKDTLGLAEFVNADTIARGLSEFSPESVAFEAGRIMLQRIRSLADRRASFAFETTLATRAFALLCERLVADGYRVHLLFFWLPSPEAAIARVQQRVVCGGHYVPDEIVRRRYHRGLENLFSLYIPRVSTWRVYNNARSRPMLVASSGGVADEKTWNTIRSRHGFSE